MFKSNLWRQIGSAALFVVAVAHPAWAGEPPFMSSEEWQASATALSEPPKQVIVIQAKQGASATLALWQETGGTWVQRAGPWPAVVGKNGMAQPGLKKEGDLKTPAGLFSISSAFGEAGHGDTGLPYRMATERDVWIDDPDSPLYNQWSQLPTSAHSFERLKRKDGLYRLGLIVDYNGHPVVPGAGSAIFIHVWRAEGKGTAGCAALAEEHLRALVAALRREDHPAALFLR